MEMAEEDANIFSGPKLPLSIPGISLGQFMFSKLKSFTSDYILIYEGDTERTVTPPVFLEQCVKVAESIKNAELVPGDVITVLGSGIDVYATATGALFQGVTVSPMDNKLDPEIFQSILLRTEPKLVFCDKDVSEYVAEVLARLENNAKLIIYNADPDEETSSHERFENFLKEEVDVEEFEPVPTENNEESVAFILCSSGTLGIPKPTMLTDKNLLYQVTLWEMLSNFNKLFCCQSISFSFFFWVSGIVMYMTTVCQGLESTIVRKLEAKHILEVMEKRRPVWGLFSPALAKQVINHPDFPNYDLSSFIIMVTAGCPLQKAVLEKIKEIWGPQILCKQSYGMTELAGSATASGPDDDPLSAGRLIPGFEMKILDIIDGTSKGPDEQGEIYLRSPSIMKGYKNNEEATEEILVDGWIKTGDVGYYTEKGLLYVVGRKKDFIINNGQLISPNEIEDVIISVPGVYDVGVAGIDVDDDILLMGLVVKLENSEVSEEDVIKSVNENLPDYKRLRGGVCFVDKIPKTITGKMKRGELLELAKSLYMGE